MGVRLTETTMRSLPRGVWYYATLLIFLFAIASVAAWTTMSYLYENIRGEEYQRILNMVSFKVWALTMGFMFIAGAFGLWAIQSSAESESRFRIGQVVAGMDYLNDGLIVVDKNGEIAGFNPSAKGMMPSDVQLNATMQQVFQCLDDHDMAILLDAHGPNEVVKDVADSTGRRTLRFRSQTAGGIKLILVSDVTRMRTHELRRQQIARLELIGRIARGVANDFSNILSGISAHTSLLLRLKPGSPDIKESITTILRETERGAHLAGHLLEFSRLRVVGYPTDNLEEHVKKAGDLVRVGLSPAWKIETTVETDLPPVSLSGLQVEQVVLNLGLVAADSMTKPGVLRVTAGKPSRAPLMDVDSGFAAVIVISAAKSPNSQDSESGQWVDARTTLEDAGVILSVARSLLEEAGGSLDVFAASDGTRIYRMCLPYGVVDAAEDISDDGEGVLSPELLSYVARWHVLIARSNKGHDYLEETLRQANVNVERVNNVISALGRIETGQGLHAIVVEEDLLGEEAAGLLRAIVKLCPTTGVVMLSDEPKPATGAARNVVLVSRRSSPTKIIKAMVEAKAQAVRRQGE